jgi:hypothetical protein
VTPRTCPRCGGPADEARTDPGFPRPGALSRWDNATIVCSECGTGEALVQWRFGWDALHPETGARRWVRVPDNDRSNR